MDVTQIQHLIPRTISLPLPSPDSCLALQRDYHPSISSPPSPSSFGSVHANTRKMPKTSRDQPRNAPGHKPGNPQVRIDVQPHLYVQAGVMLDPPPVISSTESLGNSLQIYTVTAKAVDVMVEGSLQSEAKHGQKKMRRRGSTKQQDPPAAPPPSVQIPASPLLRGTLTREFHQLDDGIGRMNLQTRWFASFDDLYFDTKSLGFYPHTFRLEFWIYSKTANGLELFEVKALPSIIVYDGWHSDPSRRPPTPAQRVSLSLVINAAANHIQTHQTAVSSQQAYIIGRMARHPYHSIDHEYIPPGYLHGYQEYLGPSGNVTPDVNIRREYEARAKAANKENEGLAIPGGIPSSWASDPYGHAVHTSWHLGESYAEGSGQHEPIEPSTYSLHAEGSTITAAEPEGYYHDAGGKGKGKGKTTTASSPSKRKRSTR